MAKRAPTVTVTELTELLAVNDETVRLWRQKGCPHQVERNRPRFVVAKVVGWLREQERRAAEPTSLAESEERKAKADAQLAELKLERERGLVVPVDEAASIVEAMLGQLRSTLLTVPQRVAPRLVGLTSLGQATVVLEQVITETLTALSREGR